MSAYDSNLAGRRARHRLPAGRRSAITRTVKHNHYHTHHRYEYQQYNCRQQHDSDGFFLIWMATMYCVLLLFLMLAAV